MEKLRIFIGRFTKKEYLPLWIYAAIQIAYHVIMREQEGSDALWFFRRQMDVYTMPEYLHIRYGAWTSRILIEGVLVWISRHALLWKVLDWVVWVFLAWAFTWLFPKEKRKMAAYAVVGFLLIYPMWDLKSAGWIATSVNYTWTLAFGIFSLHGVAKALRGEKASYGMWIFYTLSAIYAANMEQMSAVLFAVSFCAALACMIRKEKMRICGITWIILAVSAAEMLFILTCPGNEARNVEEIATRMPSFVSYGFLDKLNIGFMDTMHHLIVSGNLLFLCYAGILAVFVFTGTKDLKSRFAAAVPVVLNACLVGFPGALKTYFPKLYQLMNESEPMNESNYHMAANYVPTLLYLTVIGCVLVSLLAVCGTYFELFGQLLLFALAIATRVVIGFTPTIYVSQERTFLYLYMTLGISGTFLVTEHAGQLKKCERTYEALKLSGLLLAGFCIVLNLIGIGRVR